MRNIELKARKADLSLAVEVCAGLGARFVGDIRQVDTYFNVLHGRLKLREADPGRVELVQYFREDRPEARGCDYLLYPASTEVKPLLANALGVMAVVSKVRRLYLWENVRIHLDTVERLGGFIEFEAVLDEEHDDDDGHRKLEVLTEAFGLSRADICSLSYLDLVLQLPPG